MADYLKKHCKSADEYWLRKIFRSSRYDEVTLWLSVRGWLGIKENLKLQKFDPALARRAIEKGRSRPVKVDRGQYDIFLNTVRFATARGVKVVLVNMPTVDIINRRDVAGREEVRKLFRNLAGAGADCRARSPIAPEFGLLGEQSLLPGLQPYLRNPLRPLLRYHPHERSRPESTDRGNREKDKELTGT